MFLLRWSETEVDEKLKSIMSDCFDLCYSTAKQYTAEGEIPSLVAGGNIAGFLYVPALLFGEDFFPLTV